MKRFLAPILLSLVLLPAVALADAGAIATLDAAPAIVDAAPVAAAPDAPAVAAPADANALTEAAGFAFSVLEPILAMLLSWLIFRGLGYLKKKTGIELPAAMEAKIDDWVESGIHLAAEKSYKKVKAKTEKLSGPEKLETAVGFVIDMAKAQGWDTWTKAKVEAKVEAKLGAKRSSGNLP